MDPETARFLLNILMRSMDEAALTKLFAETMTIRQAHVFREALGLSFTDTKLVWRAIRTTRDAALRGA